MDDQSAEITSRCPECGASLQPGLAACPACGSPITSSLPAVAAPVAVAPTPTDPPLAAAQPADAAPTASAGGAGAESEDGMVRCDWCGHLNPAGQAQCANCGAAYPRPEMDAAFTRQAEERMRAELEVLDTMRSRRKRKGLGKLFSN